MPEGDSVYRLRDRLARATEGLEVRSGEVRSGSAAGTALSGLRVVGHETYGKHLFTRFDSGDTLHTHLRMQGSWSVTRPGRALPPRERHRVRVRMALENAVTVWGVDVPVVELLRTAGEHVVTDPLGPDPLRPDWDAAEARRRLARRPERTFVAALLDQRNIAGLGNLWANELGFLEGVHPFDPVGRVDLGHLVARAARFLRTSATVPGMYQVTTGDRAKGRSHWVVGRAGKPCLRCGTIVRVRAEVPGDPERRRTWWCPRCQPAS